MRALKLPRLLILALALLLVGGQQAALAHMIGHVAELGGAATQAVAQQGDDDHGAALSLSHSCTTCIALDSFAAPLPSAVRPAFAAAGVGVSPAPTFAPPSFAAPRRYAARAPPATL